MPVTTAEPPGDDLQPVSEDTRLLLRAMLGRPTPLMIAVTAHEVSNHPGPLIGCSHSECEAAMKEFGASCAVPAPPPAGGWKY